MDAALFQCFGPEEYRRRFLASGTRPDGRQPQQLREARLERSAIGTARGSASLRLGSSRAIAGVCAELCVAASDQPTCGRITVGIEFPPICSNTFRKGSRRGVSISTFLSGALSDVLNSPHVFDPMQLEVRKGELHWNLHAHVVCLNFDGNAFDLCLLAALAALEDTQLPALVEDTVSAVPDGVDGAPRRLAEAPLGAAADVVAEARRLEFKSRPLPVTFVRLPSDRWVLDPCAAEEDMGGATVSLCLVGGKWLVYHQGGGASAESFLGELMPAARSCTGALNELLDGGHGGAALGGT